VRARIEITEALGQGEFRVEKWIFQSQDLHHAPSPANPLADVAGKTFRKCGSDSCLACSSTGGKDGNCGHAQFLRGNRQSGRFTLCPKILQKCPSRSLRTYEFQRRGSRSCIGRSGSRVRRRGDLAGLRLSRDDRRTPWTD
jgi:hypothetical protein